MIPSPLSRVPLSPGNEGAAHLSAMDLVLDPPYQRGSVWGATRQANLWRSMLSGVHIGIIVISDRDDGQAVVVDGRQRIEAVRALYSGALSVPAWWFPEDALLVPREEHSVVAWDGLSDLGQRLCQRPMLAVQRVSGLSVDAERDLFDLINFGGVPQGQSDL